MRLSQYIIRKLISTVLTLFGLSFLLYFTTILVPVDVRVQLFIEEQRIQNPFAPDPTLALIEKYGLNDPFPIQYLKWLKGILKGSFGWSYEYNLPVTDVILRYFPATLELVMYAAPLILIGGYKLGVYSAKRASVKSPREDPIDFLIRGLTTIGYSIPAFCLALPLLLIFYLGLSWFGLNRLGLDANIFVKSSQWTSYTRLYTIDALLNGQLWIFFDALNHLILPVLTLTINMLAIIARITRSGMIGELIKPQIITARAMGLDEGKVLSHAKKGSLSSVLTVSGILFAGMLTGVVVIEYIFVFPGLGSVVVKAAQRFDYALLVGISLVFCVVFMLVNLIVDITYAYIDPRVKP
ncbi:MAG: ABC transporter permease [Candidatus Heimdallarchaeota archaeon]